MCQPSWFYYGSGKLALLLFVCVGMRRVGDSQTSYLRPGSLPGARPSDLELATDLLP